jgi:flavin-binding protein dodecin/uncharacterized protein (DUF433 family)
MPVTTTLTEEITATSETSPEEAIMEATARTRSHLTGIEALKVKHVELVLKGGNFAGYRVTLEVTHAGEAEPTEREGDSIRDRSRLYPLAPKPHLPLRSRVRVPLRTDKDGVVRVGKTRVTLDTVVAAFRLGETAEGIVEQYPSLHLVDVYLVLGYYLLYRDEIDAYVAEREHEAAHLRQKIEADFDPTGLRARLLARRTSA